MKKIAVIGAGTMGNGIAHTFAQNNFCVNLIDISEEDLVNSYKQIRKELGEYSKELLKKKEIIVLNKVDLLSQKELKNKRMKFEEKLNKKVIQLSTFDKKLISNLKIKLLKNVS